jgi:hypothetical protein
MRQRQPRRVDASHLAYIRQLPCLVCLDNTATEAAHVRMPAIEADKPKIGLQEKPDDVWVLPLCGACHRRQHHDGEKKFWDFGIFNPIFLCLALYRVSGDTEAGERIIRAAH